MTVCTCFCKTHDKSIIIVPCKIILISCFSTVQYLKGFGLPQTFYVELDILARNHTPLKKSIISVLLPVHGKSSFVWSASDLSNGSIFRKRKIANSWTTIIIVVTYLATTFGLQCSLCVFKVSLKFASFANCTCCLKGESTTMGNASWMCCGQSHFNNVNY